MFTLIAHLYILNAIISDKHSSALNAFVFITSFQIMLLCISLVEQWAKFKSSSPNYHHGFDRAIIIGKNHCLISSFQPNLASLTAFFLTILKCSWSIIFSLGTFLSSNEPYHHFRHPTLVSTAGIIFAFNLVIHYFLDPGCNHFAKLVGSCPTNWLQAEFHRLFKFVLFSTTPPHPILTLKYVF